MPLVPLAGRTNAAGIASRRLHLNRRKKRVYARVRHRAAPFLDLSLAASAARASPSLQPEKTRPAGTRDVATVAEELTVNMNGRIYDPRLGRFLSVDPVYDRMYQTQGVNAYSYVRNNPVSYTDPTGLAGTGGVSGPVYEGGSQPPFVVTSNRGSPLPPWPSGPSLSLVVAGGGVANPWTPRSNAATMNQSFLNGGLIATATQGVAFSTDPATPEGTFGNPIDGEWVYTAYWPDEVGGFWPSAAVSIETGDVVRLPVRMAPGAIPLLLPTDGTPLEPIGALLGGAGLVRAGARAAFARAIAPLEQMGISSLGTEARALPRLHGNSSLAGGAHDVYVMRDVKTGQIYHFGETGRGYQVRGAEWARILDKQFGLKADVQLLRTVEGKAAAKALETRYIKTFEKAFGTKPGFMDESGVFIQIQKTRH